MLQSVLVIAVLGLLGGVAVGLQQPLTNIIGRQLGILESAFIIQLSGAIASAIPLLLARGGNIAQWQSVPWYALCGGVFGLVVLIAINFTFPRLGATTTTFLIVAGQLAISVVLDHFGLFGTTVRPIDLSRVLGILVLFVALWLIIR
jgi:bacterial/archaeal transporter family-2 protein